MAKESRIARRDKDKHKDKRRSSVHIRKVEENLKRHRERNIRK